MALSMEISFTALLLSLFTCFVTTHGLLFELFEGGKCDFFADDLFKTRVSYTECLDHCKTRATCKAINFRAMGLSCTMNFQTSLLGPERCLGYVYSKKSDWTQTDCTCPEGHQCNATSGCDVTECNVPVHPLNGKLFGNIFSVGYKVAYTCNPGYVLTSGTSQSTCGTDGNWSGVVPVCVIDTTCVNDLVIGPNGVADSQLTATSYWCQGRSDCTFVPDGFSAKYGRLNSTGAYTGAWVAKTYDLNQYIQVDFILKKVVSEIEMQGRHNNPAYVTSFKLAHSVDCITYIDYQVSGTVQIFFGNSAPYQGVVSIGLPTPVIARCIRIKPQTWNSGIAMRFNVKGCDA